jgi:hypothetical protein
VRGCRTRTSAAAPRNSSARDGFDEEAGFDRLGAQLDRLFSRTAHATVVGKRILRPAYELFRDIAERYEGRDPITEVGLALGAAGMTPSTPSSFLCSTAS